MNFESIKDFFKDVGDILKRVITSRIVPFILIAVVLFGILFYRLFYLQIINGETYTTNYTLKTEKTISTVGTRGNIYDCNGVLIAYSELSYCVDIADSGYYSTTKEHYYALNEIINKTYDIILSHGDSILMDYSIALDDKDEYYFTVSDNALLRFLRDMYGKSNISDLSDEQRKSSAQDVVNYLKTVYKVDDSYTKEEALRIVYVRFNLAQNSYSRYISFTLANNISDETLASIVENEDTLTGVTISESTIRHYNFAECMSHIIGYTGKINSTELEQLQAIDPTYSQNDIIGKAGIEAEYETILAGSKGSITMVVDNLGRVLETTKVVETSPGADIYLTIDVVYQQKLYDLLERRLAEIICERLRDGISSSEVIGDKTYITIPVSQVINALLQNNVISMDEIANAQTPASADIYSKFLESRENVLNLIAEDLDSGTPYNQLSEQMKAYITLVRTNLINNGILNSDKITAAAAETLQTNWSAGNISLREYINGAVDAGWVNTYNLDLENDYSTTGEVVAAVIKEAIYETEHSTDINKKIYEYLILNRNVSYKNLTLILMEQGNIEYTESEYTKIENGGSLYSFYYDKILNLKITPQQLALDPCSGSCCVENPNTGDMIAIVSYPGYDINRFSGSIDSEYYASLLADRSTPLVSRATMTKIAPGSTYKPATALAALNEGVISYNTNIYCDGIFDDVSPSIKCWAYPNEHGALNLAGALAASCNEYFATLGYRLCYNSKGQLDFDYGLSVLKKYTDLLGLSTKTGIQIPETTPHASDFNPVVSAIGQGTNQYTSLNLTRYVTTLANKGTVYNSNIIQKICYNDGVVEEIHPDSYATEIDTKYFDYVHEGMRAVITSGLFDGFDDGLPITLYGKSGTAQENKTRFDHSAFIMFTKDAYNEADLAVAAMIPNGNGSVNSGLLDYYAILLYYGADIPSHIFNDMQYGLQIID